MLSEVIELSYVFHLKFCKIGLQVDGTAIVRMCRLCLCDGVSQGAYSGPPFFPMSDLWM